MTDNVLDPMTALGQMLWLSSRASNYAQMPLGNIVSSFESAISTQQFRIYRSGDNAPLACVCWMWLHEEHEEAAIATMKAAPFGELEMQSDWVGGDRLWFFNFIAPFGHGRAVASDLRNNVFPGVSARAVRADKRGKIKHTALFRNEAPRSAHKAAETA